MIPTVIVSADKNQKYGTDPGKDTFDRIFLLSINEAERFFASDSARQIKSTAYAKTRGGYTNDNGYSWWWLRSPGKDSNNAANINSGGSVNYYGSMVYREPGVVRPVLWINL